MKTGQTFIVHCIIIMEIYINDTLFTKKPYLNHLIGLMKFKVVFIGDT